MSAPASSPPAGGPDLGALREILAQAEKRLAAELRVKEIIDNKAYLLIGGAVAVLFFVLSDDEFVKALKESVSFQIAGFYFLGLFVVGFVSLCRVIWRPREYGALGAFPSALLLKPYWENKNGHTAMLLELALDYEERIRRSRKNNRHKLHLYNFGFWFTLSPILLLVVAVYLPVLFSRAG